MTALVVKVLSLVAERQIVPFGEQGRKARVVPVDEIRHSVGYLLSVQESDGSFGDPHPVLHRSIMVPSAAHGHIQYERCEKGSMQSCFCVFNTESRRPKSIHDGFHHARTSPFPSVPGKQWDSGYGERE